MSVEREAKNLLKGDGYRSASASLCLVMGQMSDTSG